MQISKCSTHNQTLARQWEPKKWHVHVQWVTGLSSRYYWLNARAVAEKFSGDNIKKLEVFDPKEYGNTLHSEYYSTHCTIPENGKHDEMGT